METNLPVVKNNKAVAKIIGPISVDTFYQIVQKHGLNPQEVLELRETYRLSISYVDKLLNNGHKLPYIAAAYQIREEMGTLTDPDQSRGLVISDFMAPVYTTVQLVEAFCPDEDDIEDERIDMIVETISSLADRFSNVATWSSLISFIIELMKDDLTDVCSIVSMRPDELVEFIINQIEIQPSSLAAEDIDVSEVFTEYD